MAGRDWLFVGCEKGHDWRPHKFCNHPNGRPMDNPK